jgi:AhpD family alkylhydroperoxidase
MTDRTRVNVADAAPDVYKAMTALAETTADYVRRSELGKLTEELIKIRVSQINGCAFCLRMHTKTALGEGESTDRLAVLPAWRESRLFSDQERAALSLAEAVTRVADHQVPDDVYAAAAAVLGPSEIAAAVWTAITMNAFNRIAITSRYKA